MKKGLLIVNSYLHATKYTEIYDLLSHSASRAGMSLDVCSNGEFLVRCDNNSIYPAPPECDFILYWDKDIPLANALTKMGYRLFNTASAIALCDNKALTCDALSGIVKMPKTFRIPTTFPAIGYTNELFLDLLEDELSYPYIIKECCGSFGAQVYLVTSRKEAMNVLKTASARECIAQEYIRESQGRDIRIHTVGNNIVTSMIRRNNDDYRANITNGGQMEIYKPSKAEEEMALKVAKALDLDFAGIDILFGKDEPVLCEVNSNAHFKNILSCTGVNVADKIMEHIADTI